MTILVDNNIELLWEKTLKMAENRLAVQLEQPLERYLISLLIQYTDKPEIMKTVFATTFLNAQNCDDTQRVWMLRQVGDECLLYAGLFPEVALKRHVKLSYFVDMGRSCYAGLSRITDDLFAHLAKQFVILMDVLQSIQNEPVMLPLAAYEQWEDLRSRRALLALKRYSEGLPIG